eukprot:2175051-Rhodomonas_salina.1
MTATAARDSNARKQERRVCSILFDGDRIDFIPPEEPMTYLGYDLTLTGDWKEEVWKVMNKTKRVVE